MHRKHPIVMIPIVGWLSVACTAPARTMTGGPTSLRSGPASVDRMAAASTETEPPVKLRPPQPHGAAEGAIVDERLAQAVDVEMKGGDLKALMALLTRKTGVRLSVDRDLEDWKLTVLVTQVPLRHLMRQVGRLFDLQWLRHGEEEGRYRYQLTQSLKERLTEEALRRQDEDQMLLSAVDEMEPYLKYADASLADLVRLADEAKSQADTTGSEEERHYWLDRRQMLINLRDDVFGDGLRLFARLTPDQLVALRNGQEAAFALGGDESSLPPTVAERQFRELTRFMTGGAEKASPSGFSAERHLLTGRLYLDRSRPDRTDLRIAWALEEKTDPTAFSGVGGGPPPAYRPIASSVATLASGEPDRIRQPENAQRHAGLKALPRYGSTLSLDPPSTNPAGTGDLPQADALLRDERSMAGAGDVPRDSREWLDSADVFAALRRQTGRNIVADYYTRVYPKRLFVAKDRRLLDVLDNAGDVLRSDWEEDDGFLRFRRFGYFTERALDIPNGWLGKWAASRQRSGHLTLDDLAEMATLPPTILENEDLKRALLLKYGFDEWPLVRNVKTILGFYNTLDPGQRLQAQSEAGMPLASLTPAQAQKIGEGFASWSEYLSPAGDLSQGRFFIRLRPSRTYEWREGPPKPFFPARVRVRETEKAKAEAAVEARLKTEGASGPAVDAARSAIEGPEAGLWAQFQVGHRYLAFESDRRCGSCDDYGELPSTP